MGARCRSPGTRRLSCHESELPDSDHRLGGSDREVPALGARSARRGRRWAGRPRRARREGRRAERGGRCDGPHRLPRRRASRGGIPCHLGRARPGGVPGNQRGRTSQRRRCGGEAGASPLARIRQQPRGVRAAGAPARHGGHPRYGRSTSTGARRPRANASCRRRKGGGCAPRSSGCPMSTASRKTMPTASCRRLPGLPCSETRFGWTAPGTPSTSRISTTRRAASSALPISWQAGKPHRRPSSFSPAVRRGSASSRPWPSMSRAGGPRSGRRRLGPTTSRTSTGARHAPGSCSAGRRASGSGRASSG